MFDYRIIDPLNTDKDKYLEIHRELFKGAQLDENWLNWYHNDVSAENMDLKLTRTYGIFDKERLIGIWSVEPKTLCTSDGNNIRVGRCFAVGVSSDYRRMGLFVSLSKFAIESEKQFGDYKYILGFPQTGRSVIGGHLKAGWEEVAFFDISSVNLHDIKEKKDRTDIQVICDFKTLNEYLNTPNSFIETNNYRNVRFLKHPKLQYMIFSLGNAHIVLKQYSTFCHILEMRGDNDDIINLLEACKTICRRHGLEEINVWTSDCFYYKEPLRLCGFNKGANHGLPVTLIAVSIKANEKFKFSNSMNFGMGVEEGY